MNRTDDGNSKIKIRATGEFGDHIKDKKNKCTSFKMNFKSVLSYDYLK